MNLRPPREAIVVPTPNPGRRLAKAMGSSKTDCLAMRSSIVRRDVGGGLARPGSLHGEVVLERAAARNSLLHLLLPPRNFFFFFLSTAFGVTSLPVSSLVEVTFSGLTSREEASDDGVDSAAAVQPSLSRCGRSSRDSKRSARRRRFSSSAPTALYSVPLNSAMRSLISNVDSCCDSGGDDGGGGVRVVAEGG